MSTQQEEMLVLIDDQLRTQENEGEPPVVREIARWLFVVIPHTGSMRRKTWTG